MSQVAKDAGLSRECPCRVHSADGHRYFVTELKVAKALGVMLNGEAA